MLKAAFGYLRICGPTAEEKQEFKLIITALKAQWREAGGPSETVKAHCLLTHALDQYNLFDGVADKAEDYLEKGHQIGKKLDNFARRMPQGFETKEKTIIKQMAIDSDPCVREQVQAVTNRSKRIFRNILSRKKTKKVIKREEDQEERFDISNELNQILDHTEEVTWEEALTNIDEDLLLSL